MRPTIEIRRVGPSLWDVMLRRAERNAADAIEDAAEDVAKDIRANWSASSPSAPGNPPAKVSEDLDKSTMAIQEESLRSGKVKWLVVALVPYAKMLEFGTKKMQPRPFMRPAMHRARKKFKGRFKALFKG